jgi:hypothetical protein
MGGQGEQVRLLFLVEFEGSALGLAVDAHVGGRGQPVGRDLVQVIEGAEGAAIEQIFSTYPKGRSTLPLVCGCRGRQTQGRKA